MQTTVFWRELQCFRKKERKYDILKKFYAIQDIDAVLAGLSIVFIPHCGSKRAIQITSNEMR